MTAAEQDQGIEFVDKFGGRRAKCGPLDKGEFAELCTRIRDLHGCPPKGIGRSNHERTHERKVTTLSYWIREVPNIRSIDIDQVMYCPRCVEPLAWFETKPSNNPDEWAFIRELARRLGCYAVLGVEPDQRIEHFDEFIVYIPAGKPDPRGAAC